MAGNLIGQWADPDADYPDLDAYTDTDPFFHFLPLLFANSIVVVCPVGNEGSPENAFNLALHSPRRYARPGQVGENELIVVGGTEKDNAIWSGSNKYFSIITTYAPAADISCVDTTNSGFATKSGTSISTAITSGLIATF